jgi:FkbM family methyltransferase
MNPIKRSVRWSLRKLGLDVHRVNGAGAGPSGDRLVDYFRHLKRFGFSPRTVYDIGANRGMWTSKVLQVYPDAEFVMFEPQRKLAADLGRVMGGRSNVKWRRCAVSAAVGTAEFAEMDWDVCSRLSEEIDEAWEVKANRIQVETTTVDEEVRRNGGRVPDLLKVDAEGHDMKVLDGARDTLGRTEVVLVEASVNCPTMENTVRTVVNRMSEEGYALTGIVDLNDFQLPGKQLGGLLWLVDLAFCRADGTLMKRLQDPTAEEESPAAATAVAAPVAV